MYGHLAKVFQILDNYYLRVHLIISSEAQVSLTLHSNYTLVSGSFSSDDVGITGKKLDNK